MSHPRTVGALLALLICILSVSAVRAQHIVTKVDSAEVIYAEGNDVVLKFANGDIKQFEIPDSSRFTVDGKVVTTRELTPGMKLTAKITTVKHPRWVESVTILQVGTVWKSIGSNLIIKTPEGENRMYRVPAGGKVNINGQPKTVDQLQEGDKITATIVITKPSGDVGTASVRKAPVTPVRVGTLLIDEGEKPVESPEAWGTTSIILAILVVLVVAGLIALAMRRKGKTVSAK